jgi:hypothetical protein
MADDDHSFAAALDDGADVLDARPGREALVGLRLDLERAGQLSARLSCPQKRAREEGIRASLVVPQLLAERTGLLAPLGRQRAKLIRLPRRGLSVADEVEAHGA